LNLADRGDVADDRTSHTHGEQAIEPDMADPHIEILEFGFSKCQFLEFRSISDSGYDEIGIDGQHVFRAEVKVVAIGRIAIASDDTDSSLGNVLQEVIAFVMVHIE
jgi:hypothetical protein